MFEIVEKFSEKDIQLSDKTLEEIKPDDDYIDNDDRYAEDDVHEQILDDEEIGEVINDDDDDKDDDDDTPPEFDEKGFNEAGFDKDGNDADGKPEFDEKGFNKTGFDKDGNDADGKPEFDEKGFNKVGNDKDGFNEKGFNETGFDKDGKSVTGKVEKDFTEGFDEDGFNPLGFDKDGKDKDGNTTPDEEISDDEDTSNLENDLVFQDIIDGKKDVSIKTEDGEVSLKDALLDWKNNKDWKKSNTEKAQEHKRNVDTHKETVKVFDEQSVALGESLSGLEKDSEFMSQADEYFGGKEKNPIRQLFETVKQSKESVATRTETDEAEQVTLQEETQKAFDDEVAVLIAQDDKFNDNRELQKLYKIAHEHNVSVTTAFELSKIPLMQEKIDNSGKTHKAELEKIQTKLDDSQKELKKRNDEVQNLKKKSTLIEPDDDSENAHGSSSEEEDDNTIHDSWEKAHESAKKRLGLKK